MKKNKQVSRIKKDLATLAVLVGLVGTPQLSRAGGDISGGGTWANLQGKKVLLDFYVSRPEVIFESGSPGVELPQSRALEAISIDRLNKAEFEVVKKAHARLDLWEKSSPVVVDLIREALARAPLFYTTYRIGFLDQHYFIPDELATRDLLDSLKTMAVYSEGFGILVSKADFDSLDERNQIGLLIHESLRHVQISYGLDLSDRALQSITAAIVLHTPEMDETLDSEKYLDGELLRVVQEPAKKREELNAIKTKICAIQKTYESKIRDLNESSEERIDLRTCDSPIFNSGDRTFALSRYAHGLAKLLSAYHYLNYQRLAREEHEIVDGSFWNLLNLSSGLISMSVGERLSGIGSSLRVLQDSTLDMSLASGIDAAINEANGPFGWAKGWLTGSRSAIRSAFERLVQQGLLKE